jgi:hypothetical protein
MLSLPNRVPVHPMRRPAKALRASSSASCAIVLFAFQKLVPCRVTSRREGLWPPIPLVRVNSRLLFAHKHIVDTARYAIRKLASEG